MSRIRLHKKKGVNPRLTYCPRCGKEANELMLIGASERIYQCRCGAKMVGGKGKCPNCGSKHDWTFLRNLEDMERLPASEPCDECKKEIAEHEKIVDEGGIYFKCSKCGAQGVIRKSEFADEVRERLGVPEGPAGIDFEGHGCPNPNCGE